MSREDRFDDDRPRPRRRRDDYDDPPRKSGTSTALILGLVIGGVVLLVGVGIAVVAFGFLFMAREQAAVVQPPAMVAREEATSEQPPNPVPLPEVPAPPSQILLERLTADQLADRVAQYAGKEVTVAGQAKSVQNLPDGSGTVEYRTLGGRKTVRAKFPKEHWTKDKVQAGDAFGVKGTVIGETERGIVDIANCVLTIHSGGLTPGGPTASAPVSAAELSKKYRTFNGKSVTVEGVVESAVETTRGLNVVLATSQGFPRVRLTFPTGKWTGDKPTAGATVSAKGTVTKAATVTTFVDVSDCDLVKHTPAKPEEAIPVSAEELTAEFDKDAKAAEAKYKGKLLRVTGEVQSVHPQGTSAVVVIMKGAKTTDKKKDGLTANAVITGETQKAAEQLKPGEMVTVTGKYLSFRVAIVGNVWSLTLHQAKYEK